jgi:hypothetical protein
MTLILWHPRPRLSGHRAIRPGEPLYQDLVQVIGYCMERKGKWRIAKVECPQEFVISHDGGRWYSSHYPIKIIEDFPLKVAEVKYLS